MHDEIEKLATLAESDNHRAFTDFRMCMIVKYGSDVYRQMWREALSYLFEGDALT